ncbi:MAG: class III signal peptide-containing protein [Methanobacterium sp. ERen5]|nr:MAG: class III signal peptide-containing protein [Methanobacterium sp. ERen5]
MNIYDDEAAQTSAEMILLFGGVIAIVVVAAFFYKNYLSGLGGNITNNDLSSVTNSINGTGNSQSLINKFS